MNFNEIYKKTNILVITGGVFSSLGKGITASSIGCLLQELGFNVINLKFDPYVNVDPGTMSPLQHGEVFVTKDGGETDLDLGNYERFLNNDLTKLSNLTTGCLYKTVIEKERNGDYLGKTVQIVPHITNEIINRVAVISNKYKPDFIVIEIGGTVGDIESIPFIEAMRQLKITYKNRVLYMHCVPVISLLTNSEVKTKPLQHSVHNLMSAGINPDFLLVRSKTGLTEQEREKIQWTTGVDKNDIIDVINQDIIFDLVECLYKQDLQGLIVKKLNIKKQFDLEKFKEWTKFTALAHSKKKYNCKLAIVGKYCANDDAYLSLYYGLRISSWYENTDLSINFIDSSTLNKENYKTELKKYDGIIIPGGFGEANTDGMLLAIQYARENKVPYLGICFGMQLATIEFAKNVLKITDATSTEFDEHTKNPIIYIIPGKDSKKNLGGTMRLGDYTCHIENKQTLAYKAYKTSDVLERHRHRYEFNNSYKPRFEAKGMIFSGMNTKNDLVEIIELNKKDHPFFIATQFHPEFTAKTLHPQPLFSALISAAKKPIKE